MPASVTFAIPFYTGTTYLTRVLHSIVAQEDQRWEAVVCDDGPEKGIEELVREHGRGRVRYQRNEQNLGLAKNFNRCIDVATTDLVTVVHGDDELMPNYAGMMIAAANRHPRAAALFCRAMIIDEHGRPAFSLVDVVKDVLINPSPSKELILEGEPGVRALLKGNFIMAPTLCFRKSVLGARRFPEHLKFVVDWELTMKILLDGDILVGIPERCYRYRRHEENATAQYTRTQLRFREESDYYDRIREVVAARGWDRCARIAEQKRMVKLNITYRALKSIVKLDLEDARRGFRLLRELSR